MCLRCRSRRLRCRTTSRSLPNWRPLLPAAVFAPAVFVPAIFAPAARSPGIRRSSASCRRGSPPPPPGIATAPAGAIAAATARAVAAATAIRVIAGSRRCIRRRRPNQRWTNRRGRSGHAATIHRCRHNRRRKQRRLRVSRASAKRTPPPRKRERFARRLASTCFRVFSSFMATGAVTRIMSFLSRSARAGLSFVLSRIRAPDGRE